jgi:aspartyl-tRNA(Asn)/glutamyl-tRNA(Gln) amidotransferase subunit C
MSAPIIDIYRIATLSRLRLTEAEATQYSAQLGKILDYMSTLENYNLADVDPSPHALPVYDVWRADIAKPSFTQDEALANAPRRSNDQFMMGKVVE